MADRATVEIAWRARAADWLRRRATIATDPRIVSETAKASGTTYAQALANSEAIGWILGQAALGLLGEVEMIRDGRLDKVEPSEEPIDGQQELPFKGEAGV